jgi:2,3-bisphosphoglycerate-independent phosphoglycerate mutase
MVDGKGPEALSAEAAVQSNYDRAVFDEMIPPTVITRTDGTPVGIVQDGDGLIFFNFRQDRAIQLTQAFVETGKTPLAGKVRLVQNLYMATMTEYRQGLPVHVAFESQELVGNLAEFLSAKGLTQFHAAESEKYAHVTAFFNCGRTDPLPGEGRQIVKSPSNTNNYVDQPEMAAPQLTEILVDKITKSDTNFILVNYANADMVGHTGSLEASQLAVASIDTSMGKVAEAALQADAALIITADHGNIEQLVNVKTGEIDKDHSTNPVPCIVVANEFRQAREARPNYEALAGVVPEGAVSDVAPTILELFGLDKRPTMAILSNW